MKNDKLGINKFGVMSEEKLLIKKQNKVKSCLKITSLNSFNFELNLTQTPSQNKIKNYFDNTSKNNEKFTSNDGLTLSTSQSRFSMNGSNKFYLEKIKKTLKDDPNNLNTKKNREDKNRISKISK